MKAEDLDCEAVPGLLRQLRDPRRGFPADFDSEFLCFSAIFPRYSFLPSNPSLAPRLIRGQACT